jgi:hypothetical protein
MSFSPTDVHRRLGDHLPAGKQCTGVTVVEIWTATIDGEDIAVQMPVDATVDDVAQYILSLVPSTSNAQAEGADAEMVEEPPSEQEYEGEEEAEETEEESEEEETPHHTRSHHTTRAKKKSKKK